MTRFRCKILLFCLIFGFVASFPDPGRFHLTLNSSQQFNGIVKNVYNQTKIFVKIHCNPSNIGEDKPYVQIGWVLRETKCWNEYAFIELEV